MDNEQVFPVIRQTVLDTTDPRHLAEFYRQLFGLQYRPGHEPPGPGYSAAHLHRLNSEDRGNFLLSQTARLPLLPLILRLALP